MNPSPNDKPQDQTPANAPDQQSQEQKQQFEDLQKRADSVKKLGVKLPDFKMPADMKDLKPEDISKFLQDSLEMIQSAAVAAIQQEVSGVEAKRSVDTELGKYSFYEIAKKDNPELFELAMFKISKEMEDKSKAVPDIIKNVAQSLSKLLVEKENGKDKGKKTDAADILPPAGGAAEIANLNKKREPIKNFHEAAAAARQMISSTVNKLAGAGQHA